LITSAILGKGAAGLVAVVLAVGGGSAVAMAATGSHNPEELAESVAHRVEACKDKARTDDHDKKGATDVDSHAANAARNNHGIGHCVRSKVHEKDTDEAQERENDDRDADERKAPSPSPSPGKHHDDERGDGSGSVGAAGHDRPERGNGDEGQANHGNAGDHGNHPSPSPHH
jgi:hypothetical protein